MITRLGICGFVLTLATVICPPAALSAEDTLADIKARGYVNIFMEVLFPPYEFVDQSGQVVGLDVDLAKKMFEEDLGVAVKITSVEFAGLLPALIQKKADLLISALSITQERLKRFDFSIPYSEAGTAILLRANDTAIKTPEDLSGKVVGSLTGGIAYKTAQEFDETELKGKGKPGFRELKGYGRYPLAYEDLLRGRLDAVSGARPSLRLLLKERPNQFKILGTFGPKAEYHGVVIRKGDEVLLEYVNSEVRKFKRDGTLAAIHKKWFGASEVEALPDPWTPVK